MSYGVSHFFTNGGTEAWVVRVPKPDADLAAVTLRDGRHGRNRRRARRHGPERGRVGERRPRRRRPRGPDRRSEGVQPRDHGPRDGCRRAFRNVTLDNTRPNFVEAVVNDVATGSRLVSVVATPASAGPSPPAPSAARSTSTALQNDKDYRLRLTLDVPAATNVDVTVIESGETLPSSLLGLCSMIERRINLALGALLPGAPVRCTPAADRSGSRPASRPPCSATRSTPRSLQRRSRRARCRCSAYAGRRRPSTSATTASGSAAPRRPSERREPATTARRTPRPGT